jgi:hypothetical protein
MFASKAGSHPSGAPEGVPTFGLNSQPYSITSDEAEKTLPGGQTLQLILSPFESDREKKFYEFDS